MITGASGGLGGAVVDAFLRAGDTVAGVSRSAKARPEAGYHSFAADLTTSGGSSDLAAQIVRRFGRIDVLAHLMGGFAGGQPIGETGDDTWQRMLDMNLTAAFRVFRAVMPGMIAARSGRIVAVSSRAAVQPAERISAYAVSKAGLNALVQAAALEGKEHGVTVNAVLPSTIDTEANRSWGSAGEAAKWVAPASIAEAILWLASDAAADVSGALLPVYGRA